MSQEEMVFFFSMTALAWDSASTTVLLETLEIRGEDSRARHTHGGPPANLDEARFTVSVPDTQQASLAVTEVSLLTSHDCSPPSQVTKTPLVIGLTRAAMDAPAPQLTLPSGTHPIVIHLSPVSATYTYCDRFAFRVTFTDGSQTATVIAETSVKRMEPYRAR